MMASREFKGEPKHSQWTKIPKSKLPFPLLYITYSLPHFYYGAARGLEHFENDFKQMGEIKSLQQNVKYPLYLIWIVEPE